MKIALIGASGFVGTAVLRELLDRGHEVTAIVRHPEKIQSASNLKVVACDVTDQAALVPALSGQDAVISAYNAGWTHPDLYQEFIRGSRAIQEAVKQAGLKRLIVIGGAGSLYIAPELQLVDSENFPAEWRAGASAARDYLSILQEEQSLDWTFLSPAIEMHQGTSGTRKGAYRTGGDQPVFDAAHKSIISVEDLAMAIVDELEQPQHIRQRFTVAY
ncbi:NAD(P)-dependent oxidoreductase [Niabella terrae]